jgi:hypothetical protein
VPPRPGPGNAWRLATRAQRLRIAVAELPARRRPLEAALRDALQGDAVGADWAAQEADYEFVGGEPLAAQPLVDGAGLLQIFASPRRVAQASFGALLCAPGWSADVDEADARARIEAGLRQLLPPEAALERYRAAMGRLAARVPAPRLLAGLDALLDGARAATRRQAPSAWGRVFGDLLEALGWPGQRPLLAAEAGAVDELRELLGGLSALDAILGRIDRGEALRQLRRQCRDRAFRAQRRNAPRVENLRPRRGAGRRRRRALGDRPQRRRLAAGAATESDPAGRAAAPRRRSRRARRQPGRRRARDPGAVARQRARGGFFLVASRGRKGLAPQPAAGRHRGGIVVGIAVAAAPPPPRWK